MSVISQYFSFSFEYFIDKLIWYHNRFNQIMVNKKDFDFYK